MDIKQVKKLIDLFKDSGLAEMNIEYKDLKLNLKATTNEISTIPNNIIQYSSPTNVEISQVESQSTINEAVGEWIKAPFVGTYYAAASENDAPFVTEGKKVNKGDVLFILEAMKVMNEIKAPKSGTILEIKGVNGSMVEYDENLILIGD